MRPPTIKAGSLVLLDVDGVLADYLTPWLKILGSIRKRTYTYDDVTDWDLVKALKVTDEELARVNRQVCAPGFAFDLRPYVGTQDFVAKLRVGGCKVVAVTAPFEGSQTWAYDRAKWLNHWFGITRIVSTKEKNLVCGDYLIEDNAKTLETWMYGTGILLTRPYNRKEHLRTEEFGGYNFRVSSLLDIEVG